MCFSVFTLDKKKKKPVKNKLNRRQDQHKYIKNKDRIASQYLKLQYPKYILTQKLDSYITNWLRKSHNARQGKQKVGGN